MGGGSGDSPCFSGLDGGEGEREMCVTKMGGRYVRDFGGVFSHRNSTYTYVWTRPGQLISREITVYMNHEYMNM